MGLGDLIDPLDDGLEPGLPEAPAGLSDMTCRLHNARRLRDFAGYYLVLGGVRFLLKGLQANLILIRHLVIFLFPNKITCKKAS